MFRIAPFLSLGEHLQSCCLKYLPAKFLALLCLQLHPSCALKSTCTAAPFFDTFAVTCSVQTLLLLLQKCSPCSSIKVLILYPGPNIQVDNMEYLSPSYRWLPETFPLPSRTFPLQDIFFSSTSYMYSYTISLLFLLTVYKLGQGYHTSLISFFLKRLTFAHFCPSWAVESVSSLWVLNLAFATSWPVGVEGL